MGKRMPTKKQAIDMMLQDPNLIRRPFIVKGRDFYQGFEEDTLKDFLGL